MVATYTMVGSHYKAGQVLLIMAELSSVSLIMSRGSHTPAGQSECVLIAIPKEAERRKVDTGRLAFPFSGFQLSDIC